MTNGYLFYFLFSNFNNGKLLSNDCKHGMGQVGITLRLGINSVYKCEQQDTKKSNTGKLEFCYCQQEKPLQGMKGEFSNKSTNSYDNWFFFDAQ